MNKCFYGKCYLLITNMIDILLARKA